MERGEGVDVTIHMITHGLLIEAFTQSLYSLNVFFCLANKMHSFHYCQTMKLSNVQQVKISHSRIL